MVLTLLEVTNPEHHAAIAAVWNAACGPDLAITEVAAEYNTRPTTGGVQAGRVALADGAPVGFVHASVLQGDPVVTSPEVGWVDAIAVVPDHQRQGIGQALLAWAEDWLVGQGARRIRLGGSMRPFVPGPPTESGVKEFFIRRGYQAQPGHETAWDLAHRLADYVSPSSARAKTPVEVRQAQPEDAEALLAFLRREFPGRWRFEYEEHLAEGGRISDYMILVSANGIDGSSQLTFEDSLRPLDRFFMHRLPRPWGQLGSIGVSEARRGLGYGGALLDGGLRCLRDAGVNGCVIDWTGLLEFYGKFGFKPYRRYEMLGKVLGGK